MLCADTVQVGPVLLGAVVTGIGLLLVVNGLGSLRTWVTLRGTAAAAVGTVDPGPPNWRERPSRRIEL